MQQIHEFYGPGKFGLSFELFPPKTPAKERELYEVVAELAKFGPDFVTCTYGAGGSTREKTLEVITQVKAKIHCPVATHLTCVGSTGVQIRQYLQEASDRSVDYVVALRGDPPKGESEFRPVEGGFRYACELVELINAEFPHFGIAVAAYPETHQEASSPEADLVHLKHKIDCGADVVITQLFYDNSDFYSFRDRYEKAGITAPLVPGLLPITNFAQIKRITSLCAAKLPPSMVRDFEKCGDDLDAQFEVGLRYAAEQVQDLIAHQVPGMHFYVLNQSAAARRLLPGLNLPESSVSAV